MGPSVPLAYYNTGVTSGMTAGTTQTLASGSTSPAAVRGQVVGGSANVYVAGLVAGALALMVLVHLLGFRFAFDVHGGR